LGFVRENQGHFSGSAGEGIVVLPGEGSFHGCEKKFRIQKGLSLAKTGKLNYF